MWIMMLILGIGIIFYYVINEWAEGVYGGLDAVILCLVLLALLFLSYHLTLAYSPLLGSLPSSLVVGYVYYHNRKKSASAIYSKNAEKYRKMIAQDPKNVVFREMLADTLYELGDIDQAIIEISAAVNLGAGPSCQYKLKKWTLRRKVLYDGVPVCRWCDTENELGRVLCKKCGFELPYDSPMTRKLFAGKKTQRVLHTIIIMTASAIVTALLLDFAGQIYIPLAFGLLAVWGWKIIKDTRT